MLLDPQTAEASQAQLLQRIASQDREALSEFYDQVGGVLYSTALRILGDGHEAEEVIQDVFVQIWEKAATFDAGLGAPFHWALGIARNRSIDRLRSRQRRARLLDELQQAAPPDSSVHATSALTSLEEDELRSVRAAVRNLPDEQRQPIELAFFKGLTHIEIAELLNTPLGTVKARIRRGMLKLREHLQTYA